MNRTYFLNHSPIEFYFKQSARDFVVDEIPLYEFSGEGEHLVLHVRKKNLTTWEMCEKISSYLKIKSRDIGYAGLKDKNALTKQYISIHKKYEETIDAMDIENIKVLEKTYHNNKIKTGHLKGNRFFIRVKKVSPLNATKLTNALEEIAKYGMPNFFGYQRFGIHGDNYKLGKEIVEGARKEKNRRLKQLYINAYQSHLFNSWLSTRISYSKLIDGKNSAEIRAVINGIEDEEINELLAQEHPFKLFRGDLMMHYPYGRVFEYSSEDYARFLEKDISPTGLLCGKRVKNSIQTALEIEKEYIQEMQEDGARRYAWVYPQDIESEYKENDAWFELHFSLPKGSYATTLLEELAKRGVNNE
ncbi:MAG: tRNA pseudouridine(13) synthase TruD [Campylobacterota bacterium]|nr:tRNA pseudouridine(13) synthase TruD [Campylobacterota bacterium]